ncbi:hypothetical protein F5J12DRAFT_168639 [Pisolithus orientalis]|uniref:uncharacterized protein n=1 Tax=Pisolithus orientalis TaxID=936130 RepID=UPI0022257D95|nr:uncharacterized protein F5J12DRAFT_168639 [Pisolithus orientalis]KAI6003259.1 hypothetical protein F5J12DRAFT_168639 [Pisolithus orientalis]
MAGNQSKNHRIPAGLLPNVASSQGPSQAPVGRSTSYVGTSRNASGGTLSRVRRFFYRSKECFQSSTISDSRELEVNAGQVQGEYLPEIQGSGDNAQPGRIPATIGGDIGAAFDGRELTSHIDGGTVDLTAFKDFNEVITTLPEIHPYFHMALGILTAASHISIVALESIES